MRGECRGAWVDAEGWGGRALSRGGANGPLARPGSLVLFGSCSICLNVFRVGYGMSHIRCKSQLELVFPAIEIDLGGPRILRTAGTERML